MRTAISTILAVLLLTHALAAAAQEKKPAAPEHSVPPVWSSFYNAEQGPLPDISGWKVELDQRGIVVRVAPGADWRQFSKALAGETRFTGSEMSLKPREIAQVTDYLQQRLEKDLPKVKLAPAAGGRGELVVDANITDAKTVNRLWNYSLELGAGVAPGVAGADQGKAAVIAWIRQGRKGPAIAAIQMRDSGRRYEVGLNLLRTGQIRSILREDSHTIAWAIGELSREAAGEPANKKKH